MKISEINGETETHPLNVKLKSATMTELNQIPTMAGGVICTGYELKYVFVALLISLN